MSLCCGEFICPNPNCPKNAKAKYFGDKIFTFQGNWAKHVNKCYPIYWVRSLRKRIREERCSWIRRNLKQALKEELRRQYEKMHKGNPCRHRFGIVGAGLAACLSGIKKTAR